MITDPWWNLKIYIFWSVAANETIYLHVFLCRYISHYICIYSSRQKLCWKKIWCFHNFHWARSFSYSQTREIFLLIDFIDKCSSPTCITYISFSEKLCYWGGITWFDRGLDLPLAAYCIKKVYIVYEIAKRFLKELYENEPVLGP